MIFFLIGVFVGCMQTRLRENKIGHKKEFLREIVKEVRINGDKITLTYKLPITQKTPGSGSEGSGNQEFFTLCHLVEAGGIEPPSENATSGRSYMLSRLFDLALQPPSGRLPKDQPV